MTQKLKANDIRDTPWELFNEIQAIYGFPFQVDVCATHFNTKCARYFTLEGLYEAKRSKRPDGAPEFNTERTKVCDYHGLQGRWGRHWWCNPPFSDIRPWVQAAWNQREPGAMIIPCTNKEQGFYQDLVEPWRDAPEERYSFEERTHLEREMPAVVASARMQGIHLYTRELRARRDFLENGETIWQRNKDGSFKLDENGARMKGQPRFGITVLLFRGSRMRPPQPYWADLANRGPEGVSDQ